METHHRTIAGRRLHRKPLGDCTNTISRTTRQQSSSSSSSVKFANPSLTSSLKRLVDQTSLKEKHNDDAANNSKTIAGIATSLRPLTRRITADLRFPAPTPTSRPSKPRDVDESEAAPTRVRRPVTSRVSTDLCPRRQNSRSGEGVVGGGGGDKEVVAEPYSVYSVRRKASSGRKRSNDAASSTAVASLRLDLISSPGKKRRQANENTVKLSKVALRKRQRTPKHEEDNLAHGVSLDYIEKQRAYFAEVDAFELAEEEVSSSDLD